MFVEKRPMEEGRPLRSEERRSKGLMTNYSSLDNSDRVYSLFVQSPSSFILQIDLYSMRHALCPLLYTLSGSRFYGYDLGHFLF